MSSLTDYKSNTKGHEIITSLLSSNAAGSGKVTGFIAGTNKGNGGICIGIPVYTSPSSSISVGASSTFGKGRPNQSIGAVIRYKL